ncbi:MAG: threonylcarbamoyl-AMP synthase [Bacteroidales bacterium]|nr:threonylcarbamoyl-AMP synthase [Bacteroidales bacterium]
MNNLEKEVKKSVELLRNGKILLYPTDTIWGIGCDATNSKAVQRIYKIKGRDENKSMIVLLDSIDKLKQYIEKVPPITYDLIQNSVSPLTIVYSGAKNLAKNLIARDGTIALRVVSGEYCRAVIQQLDRPLVSTSANISGEPSANSFYQINPVIFKKVDHVVEIFRDRVRAVKPSTIIKIEENGRFMVLRS